MDGDKTSIEMSCAMMYFRNIYFSGMGVGGWIVIWKLLKKEIMRMDYVIALRLNILITVS